MVLIFICILFSLTAICCFLRSLGKEKAFIYSTVDVQTIQERYKDLKIFDSDEKALENNPKNIQLRRHILSGYLFAAPLSIKTEEARRHIYWIIENSPEVEGEWFEWALHFANDENESKKVANILKQKISEHRHNSEILRNFAIFSAIIDPNIALDCWMSLKRWESYDPEIYQRMGSLFYIGRGTVGPLLADKKIGVAIFEKLFSLPWSVDDYSRLRSFRKKRWIFALRPIAYMLLAIKSLADWRPAWRTSSYLNQGIITALEAGDVSSAAVWARQLKRMMSTDNTGDFMLASCYSTLARVDLYEGNISGVKDYLDLLVHLNTDLDESFLSVEKPILDDLKKFSQASLIKDFIEKRMSKNNRPLSDEVNKGLNLHINVQLK